MYDDGECLQNILLKSSKPNTNNNNNNLQSRRVFLSHHVLRNL